MNSSSDPKRRLLVRNARQVVTVVDNGERVLKGAEMDKALKIHNNWSVVVGCDGTIEAVGEWEEIEKRFASASFQRIVDGKHLCVVPGLVDGHTHPVWAGDRVHEFAMKLAGASYMEIHEKGGGIGFTVQHTRDASEEELSALLRERLLRMSRTGTTLVECKSGYGLNLETEMKMLKVLTRAQREQPLDLSITYLGAHSIPKGSTEEEYTKDIIERQIPEIKRLMDENVIEVDNIDVFLEKGVFGRESTRSILKAGAALGLSMNFHGDEINPMQSGELAGELNARAVSHLERVSGDGMRAMAERGSVAVLLPTTAYILRLTPPPARDLIENGVAVALGSDFNPNAHCMSMPSVMHFACVLLRLTMNEALVASTINSAASLGRSATHGSIEVGKKGDLLLVEAERWEHLVYQMVDPPIAAVYKDGVKID